MSNILQKPWNPGITVTTDRAAEMLGISRSTVLKMVQDGTLQGFPIRANVVGSPIKIIRQSVLNECERRKVRAGVDDLPPRRSV